MNAARRLGPLLVLVSAACAARGGPPATRVTGPPAALLPEEARHLADLRQLTFGGENGEAYWSFDGTELSFQARPVGAGCDRIYRMKVSDARPVAVSSGRGATTCAHFLPGGDLIYASTHLAGDACPPRPDMSRGYVWALYDTYDIFRVSAGGAAPTRLTSEKGYDAEGTVCGRDGSILFTSMRDGDPELYRMDRDGKNVRRLTNAPGYDGGAFFNADCTKIVWRASRPRPGRELDDFRALLARDLVRPTRMDLWIADADGTGARQLTYLPGASFAPSFHPREPIVLFSSNHTDPRGREFDIWAVRLDGSGLTRVTHAPGFDSFPHFSPDGQWLAFSSNRATAPGANDTNVFVARWLGLPAAAPQTPADRISRDVTWLADPAREGRGVGTRGLEEAGAYLERELRALGLEPAGDDDGFRQRFPVVTKVEAGPNTRVTLDGRTLAPDELSVLGFSSSGKAEGPLVLAGYGVVDGKLGLDDYQGLDVKGKLVLVRRFAPEGEKLADAGTRARLGDIRRKAFHARERGARALLVVDWPLPPAGAAADWQIPAEAPLLAPAPESGDAGLPVVMVKRAAVQTLLPRLAARGAARAALEVSVVATKTDAFNVVGRIRAGRPTRKGAVILGAHYDHLGYGGRHSLAPDSKLPHLGADDNASGTAVLLEIARGLAAQRESLPRDVVVAFFSGEESGLLGSTFYTRARGDLLREAIAMLNLDMVGRLRDNRLEVLGGDTAAEWDALVKDACAGEGLTCAAGGGGFGASDQAAFYAAGLPVLHFFTGNHADYHKPSDVAASINAIGAAKVAALVQRVVEAVAPREALTFRKGAPSEPRGDARSFNASLGTVPDYAGPPGGKPGVLLAGVRPGGAADRAGMKRGDILVRLGPHEVRSVEDLMFVLTQAKPGETITAVVVRDGHEVKLQTTYQESRGMR